MAPRLESQAGSGSNPSTSGLQVAPRLLEQAGAMAALEACRFGERDPKSDAWCPELWAKHEEAQLFHGGCCMLALGSQASHQ